MDWRAEVTSVSDKVFPGINCKQDTDFGGIEVLSSLPLQLALYFNVIFAPVWFVITVVIFLEDRYVCYDELYKLIVITATIAITVVELLRLYLGYEGNLKDKIPELAGFWMLSLLLQFPLQSFLLFNPYFRLHITELVVQSVMVILLLTQIISGYFALKYTATQQALYFKISKMNRNMDNTTDIKEE